MTDRRIVANVAEKKSDPSTSHNMSLWQTGSTQGFYVSANVALCCADIS